MSTKERKPTMAQQVKQRASEAMSEAVFKWAVDSLRLMRTEQVERLAEIAGVELKVPQKNPGQYKMAITAKVRAAIRSNVEDALRRAFLRNENTSALLDEVAEQWRKNIQTVSD